MKIENLLDDLKLDLQAIGADRRAMERFFIARTRLREQSQESLSEGLEVLSRIVELVPNAYKHRISLKVKAMSQLIDNSESAQTDTNIDVGLIAAIRNVEFRAVKQQLMDDDWIQERVADKIFYKGRIKSGGKDVNIACAYLQEKGMVDAAIVAGTIISQWKPKLLVNIGMAAGIYSNTNFGDLIVPTSIIRHDSGELNEDGHWHEIQPAQTDVRLLQQLQNEPDETLLKIYNAWPGRKNYSLPKVHFSPMACGSALIYSERIVNEIRNRGRNIVGYDLESYAIHRSCQLLNGGNTKALVIKAISDFAVEIHDEEREYAAFVSAQYFKHVIGKFFN